MKKQVKYSSTEVKSFVKEALRKYAGFPSMKVWQENIIRNILSQKGTIIVMPSSNRKYICFYLPILILKGKCLVISQSEKFLNNQNRFLKKLGIPFAFWDKDSSDKTEHINHSKVILIDDIKKLEKLKTFSLNIKYIIFGNESDEFESDDFRNDIQYLNYLRTLFKDIPFVVSVSSPDPEIKDILKRKDVKVFVRGYNRQNLQFMVVKGEDKLQKVSDMLCKIPGSGVIFVDSKADAEEIDRFLREENISSDIYVNKKNNFSKISENFFNGNLKVLIITNEFYKDFMKPDIRFVIHYNLPLTLTRYYYESAVAGLDGNRSYCILLYKPKDRNKLEEKIKKKYSDKDKKDAAFSQLDILEDYVFSNSCRMSYILSYFGDEEVMDRCGRCEVGVG